MPDTRPDPFELIDTPFSEAPLERWRAEALAGGAMGALQNVYDIVRADSAAAAARADAEKARTALIQHVCERIDAVTSRFDALAAKLEAAEAKRRADEQAAREFEEPIEEPPGTEEPQVDDTHAPGGELHALVPEPALELEGDEAEFELPEPKDPTGGVVPQPTSVQLNEG
jgi:hypothetical protein